MGARVTRKGKGIKSLNKITKELNGAHVRVGIPDDVTREKGAPIRMAALGFVHEYGSQVRGIPSRPFLRSALTNEKRTIGEAASRGLKVYLETNSKEQGLNIVGLGGQVAVQKNIKDGSFVPLKQETIERKGSSTPLIDEGELRQSIKYTVEHD